jgi:tetratricopeptide (TPR) repeat protein
MLKGMNQTFFSMEKRDRGLESYHKGVALDAAGKTEEAIRKYRDALSDYPELAEAHYNLGVDLATLGRLDEAIRSWKRAVWLDPEYQQHLIKAFDIDHECREMEIHLRPDYPTPFSATAKIVNGRT